MENILLISGTSIVSGAEYVLADYLNNSSYAEHISVVHSDFPDVNEFYSMLPISEHISLVSLNPVGAIKKKNRAVFLKKLKKIFVFFFELRKIVKNKDYKLIYGNNTGDIIYALHAFLLRKKFIVNIHDMLFPGEMLAKTVRFFNPFVSEYIVDSRAVAESLKENGISEKKIRVIYNGLTPLEFSFKKSGKQKVFGFIGSFHERKAPLSFIRWVRVYGKNAKGRMVFRESDADKNMLNRAKEEIKQHNLNIELVGEIEREKTDDFYFSLDYLVVPSLHDPLPTVILEAFNHSRPVIARNVDGIPEMVEDGANGFLFADESSFAEISKKVESTNWMSLQKKAYETIVQRFNIQSKSSLLDEILFQKEY